VARTDTLKAEARRREKRELEKLDALIKKEERLQAQRKKKKGKKKK
jgi:hypothetical protein